jgi:hypothetical protein
MSDERDSNASDITNGTVPDADLAADNAEITEDGETSEDIKDDVEHDYAPDELRSAMPDETHTDEPDRVP